MTKQYVLFLIAVFIMVMSAIASKQLEFISQIELKQYERQYKGYNELKKQFEGLKEIVEGYKSDYNNLEKKYKQAKTEYDNYIKETSIDLDKELDNLKKQKEKYTNLINEINSKLEHE